MFKFLHTLKNRVKLSDDTANGLVTFNLFMGFFHLIQGFILLFLSNEFSLPITTNYLSPDVATKSANPLLETIATLKIGPLVAAFLFLSALAHFTLASPIMRDWYIKNLKNRINYARWIEYAFSSSIMIVVIAMLCGIYDLSSLILLFALNAVMNLMGLMMELHNQTTKKTNWTSFLIGCFAGIVPWIVITLYFVGAASRANGVIPTFVYFILGSLFVTFNIFAINMFLQYKQVGKWKDYIFGEKAYIVLSLVAKSLLAWQVFSGTLRGS